MSIAETNEPTWHILSTPMEEVWRRPDGERWCFRCRKRRAFEVVVSRPHDRPRDDTGAWYGPSAQIECATCHLEDSDCFPGTGREWE